MRSGIARRAVVMTVRGVGGRVRVSVQAAGSAAARGMARGFGVVVAHGHAKSAGGRSERLQGNRKHE